MPIKQWTADDVTDEQCNAILHGYPPWTQKERESVALELNSTGTFCDQTEIMKERNKLVAIAHKKMERFYFSCRQTIRVIDRDFGGDAL
jgi:hypothetical protein